MSRETFNPFDRAICFATLAQALVLSGCYQSWGDHGDVHDAATDADATVDTADTPADTTDAHVDSVDVPMDSSDVPPDSPLVCPPPAGDGTWMSFTTTGSTTLESGETPCRVESVGTGTDGTWILELWCGTGAHMETETIAVTANPLITPMIFEGDEVIFRFSRPESWWSRNEWFAIHAPAGHLIMAGVAATSVAPWEWEASDWYDPLSVYVVGGVCPPEETSCGTLERRAIEVHSAGDTGRIYDGYTGYVGTTAPVYIHVSTAYAYLDMDCDDAPDAYYEALFVPMMP